MGKGRPTGLLAQYLRDGVNLDELSMDMTHFLLPLIILSIKG